MMHRVPLAAQKIAANQDGVISRKQLLLCGANKSVCEYFSKHNQMYPGIYWMTKLNGEQPRWRTKAWAGILAAGNLARLGFRSAAKILEISNPRYDDLESQITILTPRARGNLKIPGYKIIREHKHIRTNSIGALPCTGYADTIIDVASTCRSDEQVVSWLTKGLQTQKVTAQAMKNSADRRTRLRNRKLILEILVDLAAGTSSVLEYRFLHDVIVAHGLPRAEQQKRSGRYRVDFAYPMFLLVIELDGQLGHIGEGLWRDMERDNMHSLSGVNTLRFGWHAVTSQPCEVAAQVLYMLRANGYNGSVKTCGQFCALAVEFKR